MIEIIDKHGQPVTVGDTVRINTLTCKGEFGVFLERGELRIDFADVGTEHATLYSFYLSTFEKVQVDTL